MSARSEWARERALIAAESSRMAYEFKTRRRIEFVDTDMAGIVHFSNYFRFMESVEHEFFTSLGLRLHGEENGRMFGWARVHASCDYLSPARYLDELEAHLTVRAKTGTSIRYRCEFHVKDDEAPSGVRQVARGEIKVVYVARAAGQDRIKSSAMPDAVAQLIDVAPDDPES